MRIYNIHEAKTHLSRLIEPSRRRASRSSSRRPAKPLVKVVPVDAADVGTTPRIGFLVGEIAVPDDFDRMGRDEIETLFGGEA